MTTVEISGLYKKFGFKWLIKDLSTTFSSGVPVAVLGPNGSGKSTLLKLIAGMIPPNRGKVIWKKEGEIIRDYNWYKYLGFCAPYMELHEALNFDELFVFYSKLIRNKSVGPDEVWKDLSLPADRSRPIAQYSSGMKQKLKLTFSMIKNPDVLLLDEPLSNLDESNTQWYYTQMEKHKNALIIVASNDEKEYPFAQKQININDYR